MPHLVLWNSPSAPLRPGQRNGPGHMPKREESGDTCWLVLPEAGKSLQMGLVQKLNK